MKKKGRKRKCSYIKEVMLSYHRQNTLRELDKVIKERAEELWELRVMRAGLRKVVNLDDMPAQPNPYAASDFKGPRYSETTGRWY